MTARLATPIRTARMQAIVNAIDAAAGPGTLALYDGAQPASAGGEITTQVLLGTVTFSATSGSVTDGVLTFYAVTQDSAADATGVTTWARIRDGDGLFVADLDAGLIGSGAAIQMVNTQIYQGGVISVTSGVIADGNG